MATKKKKMWIQAAKPNPGALHRQLRYSQGDTLPIGLLTDIKKANVGTHVRGYPVTPLLKKRVNFALNVRRPRK